MKGKIIVIVILGMFLFAAAPTMGMSASNGGGAQPLNFSPNPPVILGCYNIIYGHGEKVDQAWSKILYGYLIQNTDSHTVTFFVEWGDGNTETTGETEQYRYVNHGYAQGQDYGYDHYTIRAKAVYQGVESDWSNSFDIPVIDHCDLDITKVSTVPTQFRPGARIDITATVKNVGSIPTTSSQIKVTFYDGYDADSSKMIGEPQYIGQLAPDQEQQVTSVPFKWYKDKVTHGILVVVDVIPRERTDVNNQNIGNFNAPRAMCKVIMNPVFMKLFERFPLLASRL